LGSIDSRILFKEGVMKQGIIIYLLGGGILPEGVDVGAYYQGLGTPTCPLEIVISQPGKLDLDTAWHFLLRKGCEPIHLLVAQTDHDSLQPIYPLVRLTNVARDTGDLTKINLPELTLH
jgi:hypothetical protein